MGFGGKSGQVKNQSVKFNKIDAKLLEILRQKNIELVLKNPEKASIILSSWISANQDKNKKIKAA